MYVHYVYLFFFLLFEYNISIKIMAVWLVHTTGFDFWNCITDMFSVTNVQNTIVDLVNYKEILNIFFDVILNISL